MIQEIHTNGAPGAVEPFSQAIKVGGLLFVSGQIRSIGRRGFNFDDAIAKAGCRSTSARRPSG
ncbi:hypothetical protein [Sinorhizobium fredii]|uniref:hypothetical protein n=1 Tax=Rhizobium fredii TaxID=380 RepID=UPI001F3E30CB|nr:hypothetical protein [Sinorhizobium fredii]